MKIKNFILIFILISLFTIVIDGASLKEDLKAAEEASDIICITGSEKSIAVVLYKRIIVYDLNGNFLWEINNNISGLTAASYDYEHQTFMFSDIRNNLCSMYTDNGEHISDYTYLDSEKNDYETFYEQISVNNYSCEIVRINFIDTMFRNKNDYVELTRKNCNPVIIYSQKRSLRSKWSEASIYFICLILVFIIILLKSKQSKSKNDF